MKRTGYWTFEVNVMPIDAPIGMADETPTPDAGATYDTERVYKKVTVDTSGDEPAAWYDQSELGPDADLANLRARDGRVYVPIEQVRSRRPDDAKPYREVVNEPSCPTCGSNDLRDKGVRSAYCPECEAYRDCGPGAFG